jgi:uncharacterized protein YbaA (DUF1428 family)
MGAYVDSMLVHVPKARLAEYRKLARLTGKVWREHGALEYVESVGDGLQPGKWTSFPRSVKLKEDEVVVFCYIVYKSRAHRDLVWKKVMADKRLAHLMVPGAMPFDSKRMIWGGFKRLVEV